MSKLNNDDLLKIHKIKKKLMNNITRKKIIICKNIWTNIMNSNEL